MLAQCSVLKEWVTSAPTAATRVFRAGNGGERWNWTEKGSIGATWGGVGPSADFDCQIQHYTGQYDTGLLAPIMGFLELPSSTGRLAGGNLRNPIMGARAFPKGRGRLTP